MPISATIARPGVMAAWGQSQGEAIHTSTFLGHPVASAAALETLEILVELDAPRRATEIEEQVRRRFSHRVRGRGAMLGVQMDNPGAAAVITGQLLRQGYIVLPGGVDGDILGLTPPLVVTDEQLGASMDAIESLIAGG